MATPAATPAPDYAALAAQAGGSYVPPAPAPPADDSRLMIPSATARTIAPSALPPAQPQAQPQSQQIDYASLAAQMGGSYIPPASPSVEGEQTNDVGNKVIVPKSGESFADTMNRARQYGTTVTRGQVSREMATAPEKVAQTLVAAPAIGAAGAAALAAPSALTSEGTGIISNTGKEIVRKSLQSTAKDWLIQHPQVIKTALASIGGLTALTELGWLVYRAGKAEK